jgi:glycosyltransferase involved in cell wall biosynthesis
MCLSLMAISPKIDTVIYYIGGANLFPPVLMGKLLRKKVIVSVVGSGSECYKKGNAKSYQIQSGLMRVFEHLNYSLADKIVVETESAIGSFDLQKYQNKIFTGGTISLDKNRFRLKKDLSGRERIIGYIGRLDEAKGVCSFLSAIPVLSRSDKDLRYLIGGTGPLYDPIKKTLEDKRLSEFVNLPGWIPHDMIVDYLNDLKILVLPSFSEGLPTIVLEAMACGTPVLATSVGCVPDVVRDGETGFLLDNNSPEYIVDKIREILNRTDLDRITENAMRLVDRDFTFDVTVEHYRNILAS